jgi:hypothetical protein
MIQYTERESLDLAEAFVVANTSASLQRWLERHPVVQQLAEQLPEDTLISELHEIINKSARTEVDLAKCYAALVALTLKRRSQPELGPLPIAGDALKWARAMWDYATKRHTSTRVYDLGKIGVPVARVRVNGDSRPVTGGLVDQHGRPLIREI